MMALVLFFLLKSLAFLLWGGVEYFCSNLDRHETNLEMLAWSLCIPTAHLFFSEMLGIMGGIVLVTAGDGTELGKTNEAGAVLGETNGTEFSDLKV